MEENVNLLQDCANALKNTMVLTVLKEFVRMIAVGTVCVTFRLEVACVLNFGPISLTAQVNLA